MSSSTTATRSGRAPPTGWRPVRRKPGVGVMTSIAASRASWRSNDATAAMRPRESGQVVDAAGIGVRTDSTETSSTVWSTRPPERALVLDRDRLVQGEQSPKPWSSHDSGRPWAAGSHLEADPEHAGEGAGETVLEAGEAALSTTQVVGCCG